ncbi:ISNCY family transposase [Tabrizicola sp. M-4]|uniref:ISNCY family transposase n=1 Tax=Tabrizicola sp. M-4 TaxID=3055847 RepID=UPI003DA96C13
MGWVLMSEREVHRVEVLSGVVAGRMSTSEAASVLCLSERQVQRLLRTFREDGAVALRHKSRGRPSNNRRLEGLRDLTLAIVREQYADFGPTLAAEKLAERDGVNVSRETLRKWMVEDGLWLSRSQRRVFHRPRLRRECYGELVQIDGSDHRWFEDRDPPCTLIVAVDDATGAIQEMRFVPSESTFSYFEMLAGYLRSHGKPVAFYSDKHSVFRVAKSDARTGHQTTQFGRALLELNIEILCANSSQAKGRVERKNRTLQDRLVKEMRLDGITGMKAGNDWLPGYILRHNQQFARPPTRPDNLHRAVTETPDRLNDILCWRDERHVTQQLTFSYERKRIMLEETELSRSLVGKYVDTYAWADGRFEVRWKGFSLPYSVFDPDQQRVTHAAITENKRLSEVLSYAKALQDAEQKAPKIGKQRTQYTPTGKKSPGRKSWLDKRAERRAQAASTHAAE